MEDRFWHRIKKLRNKKVLKWIIWFELSQLKWNELRQMNFYEYLELFWVHKTDTF